MLKKLTISYIAIFLLMMAGCSVVESEKNNQEAYYKLQHEKRMTGYAPDHPFFCRNSSTSS